MVYLYQIKEYITRKYVSTTEYVRYAINNSANCRKQDKLCHRSVGVNISLSNKRSFLREILTLLEGEMRQKSISTVYLYVVVENKVRSDYN